MRFAPARSKEGRVGGEPRTLGDVSLGSPPWCDLEDRFGRDAGSDLRDLLRRLRALELEGRLTLLGRLALRDLLLRNRLALRDLLLELLLLLLLLNRLALRDLLLLELLLLLRNRWPCGAGWLPPDAAFVKIVVPQRRVGPTSTTSMSTE